MGKLAAAVLACVLGCDAVPPRNPPLPPSAPADAGLCLVYAPRPAYVPCDGLDGGADSVD